MGSRPGRPLNWRPRAADNRPMGKSGVVLVLLIVGLGVGGAGNYRRNAYMAEQVADRPLAQYQTEDLEMLLHEHQRELERIEARLGRVSNDADQMGEYAASDLKGKVEGFGRFQKKNEAWKVIYRQSLDQQVEIQRVKDELAIRRQGLDDEWNLVLRRILTL